MTRIEGHYTVLEGATRKTCEILGVTDPALMVGELERRLKAPETKQLEERVKELEL